MLATRGGTVPRGPGWLHEVKWDGMRVLASVRRRPAAAAVAQRERRDGLVPRAGRAWRTRRAGGRDLLLDGEVVAFLDGRARASARLADRMHVKNARKAEAAAARNPVTLMVFDLLALDGLDVTGLPAGGPPRRPRALWSSTVRTGRCRRRTTTAQVLLEATKAQGLEGIVSKRRSSPYRPGQRSEDWLKFPHRPSASYVVGGWRPETGIGDPARRRCSWGSRPPRAGLPRPGRQRPGRQGGGAAEGAARPAGRRRAAVHRTRCRARTRSGTRWVRPEVVVEVASLGLTPQQPAPPAGVPRRPRRPEPRGPARPGGRPMAERRPSEARGGPRRGRRPDARR